MAKRLAVDDEPSIVLMLSMHLRLAGHVCLPMAEAKAAV